MEAIDDWFPLVHVLEGEHVIRLELVKSATNGKSALADTASSQYGYAFVNEKGRIAVIVVIVGWKVLWGVVSVVGVVGR